MTRPRRKAVAFCCGVTIVAAIVGAVLWGKGRHGDDGLRAFSRSGTGIMGTSYRLTAVAPAGRADVAARAMQAAEDALRGIEARMSTYLEASDVSRLNAAGANEFVDLSPPTLEVLRLARGFTDQTGGAFDPTCRPILQLWIASAREDRPPTEAELAEASRLTGWRHIQLTDRGATKLLAGAGVALGAIAKGYGVDQAVEAMIAAGCEGGMVEVGGDLRTFGPRAGGGKWRVGIRSPFAPDEFIATVAADAAGVCTSGNYERFSTIRGRRYSHIVDPRTAMPADSAPSVTVVAPTAAAADAWATALSVLGPGGLEMIRGEERIEAMMVIGGPDDYKCSATEGFGKLLAATPGNPAPTGIRAPVAGP